MGGVDLTDELNAVYRPIIRAKRWWWNLAINGFVTMMTAAYRLYQLLHETEPDVPSHLDFVRAVTVAMGLSAQESPNRGLLSLPGPKNPVNDDVRTDKVNHYVVSMNGYQRLCVQCKKNTRKWCPKCEKAMHAECAAEFHRK